MTRFLKRAAERWSYPKGTYDTGAITLKDNVNLCLEDKETKLQFTQDINHDNYPLVYSHWEGQPMYNYSAFIYAKEKMNVLFCNPCRDRIEGSVRSSLLRQARR